MALKTVHALQKLVHEGRFVEVGQEIEVEAEHADVLVEDGLAGTAAAAKKLLKRSDDEE